MTANLTQVDSRAVKACWRRHHWTILLIATAAIGLSFLLRTTSAEDASVSLGGIPLPPLCLSREGFGVSCPGCGLTRSFVHLARGDWHAARQAHPLGWLVALMVLAQIPYRLHQLIRPQQQFLSARAGRFAGFGLVWALVIHWFIDRVVLG